MDIWLERYPTAEQVISENHPALETVRKELRTLQEEREMQQYWDAKYHLQIDGAVLTEWDRVTRRRWVRQFTKQQMELGERILNGLHNSQVGNA